jgi:hypothetical protein
MTHGRLSSLAIPLVVAALVSPVTPVRADEPPGEIQGIVRDTDGHPVADAQVEIHGETGTEADQPTRSPTQTAADGTFRITRLLPGRYSLSASKWGYASPPIGCADTDGAACGRVEVGASNVSLTLRPQAAWTGRVTGTDGRPITSFEINGVQLHSDQGRFRVPSHGGSELRVSATGFLSTTIKVSPPRGNEQAVADVVLKATRVVKVHVRDVRTGKPVAQARAVLAFKTTDTPAAGASDELEDLLERHREESFERMQKNSLLNRSPRAPSDAHGDLVLNELPEEKIQLNVVRAGYREQVVDLDPATNELTVQLTPTP